MQGILWLDGYLDCLFIQLWEEIDQLARDREAHDPFRSIQYLPQTPEGPVSSNAMLIRAEVICGFWGRASVKFESGHQVHKYRLAWRDTGNHGGECKDAFIFCLLYPVYEG